jgi:glycogen debranching enzyme
MDEAIQVNDQFYIQATAKFGDDRTKVIKHNETFALFDRCGDIENIGRREQGIFHQGTRFLSELLLRLGSKQPLLLSSTITRDNVLFTIDLTNPDFTNSGEVKVPRGTIHIFRSKFLWNAVCYERLRIFNYGESPVLLSLDFDFDADFADIFEVRGLVRQRRGERLDAEIDADSVVLVYRGLDKLIRRTRMQFWPTPQEISANRAHLEVLILPKEEKNYHLTISCELGHSTSPAVAYAQAAGAALTSSKSAADQDCSIITSNLEFNEWLDRSSADLRMLVTRLATGPYPFAGVPWFSTVFGRDGIITALQYLWMNPEIARGVLSYLASTQAQVVNAQRDAAPGKILHETRKGEMAQCQEIPFDHYYGSADSTPLFVLLAACYYARTGNRSFIESIWQHIELALEWIDRYGDLDGDGFVEYLRSSSEGLLQQGWKDSYDSIFHADGSLAQGPIALCEVQGYVYAAKLRAAQLARELGKSQRARELSEQARLFRQQFNQAFWSESLSTYVLALDGKKARCEVRTSNAGHCLFSGVADPDQALKIAGILLGEGFFSGWGIRTVHSSEVRYNPMSYHNGSVWPHDNALIAQGLASYGLKEQVVAVVSGLFEASSFMDLQRLPELFCGFHRRSGEGPTLYPVACSPQAWSAASPFLLLQALLGLNLRIHPNKQVSFVRPLLPDFLQQVQISSLLVGDSLVDLRLERQGSEVDVKLQSRKEDVELVILRESPPLQPFAPL